MADYLIQDTTLDAIANAINAKTGGSSAMTPAQMVTAIGSISGGSGGDYDFRTVDITLAQEASFDSILNQYVDQTKLVAVRIYPTDADNTQLNTFALAMLPNAFPAVTGANGAVFPRTIYQYAVNDQTYNAFRLRGNILNKPVGNYRLEVYGTLL